MVGLGMTWELAAEILPVALPVFIGCGIFAIVCAGLIVKSRLKEGVWGNHIHPMSSNELKGVSDAAARKGSRTQPQANPSHDDANGQLVKSAAEQ